jgi:membrane protein
MVSFIKELGSRIAQHDCAGLAAEMAYHFLLASGPTVVFILSLLSMFTDVSTVSTQFLQYADKLLPADAMAIVWNLIEKVLQGGSGELAVISFLGALWASSNAASTLIKALRRAYNFNEVDEEMRNMGMVRQRIFSILMVLIVSVGMFIASNLLIWGGTLIELASHVAHIPIPMNQKILFSMARWGIVVVVLLGLSSLIYKMVPGHEASTLRWRQTFVGSCVFVGLWVMASLGFSLYVENFGHYNEVYGSLGAMIVLILWLQLSSLAFLMGGEMNALLDKRNILEPNRPHHSTPMNTSPHITH